MKLEKGFRIPEATDRSIQWPARSGDDPIIAVWSKSSAAWLVPGFATAFGSPTKLVQQFGNDWHRITIDRVPEAAS